METEVLLVKEENLAYSVSVVRKHTQDDQVAYIFDFGEKFNGYLALEVQLNTKLDIGSIVDPQMSFRYGPRNDFLHFSDTLNVSMVGCDIFCQSPSLCSFRYAQVIVPEGWGKENVDWVFKAVYLQLEMRKVDEIGKFECSQQMLNSIWSVGNKTVHACMYPHKKAYGCRQVLGSERMSFLNTWEGHHSDYVLVDGPRRDREVWVGDLLPEVRTCWYAFKDGEVIRNSIKVFTDQQMENGFLPASSVSYQNFSEYCCWFVIVLHEYILFSGDYNFLNDISDNYRNVMKYIKSILDDKGMLDLQLMQTWAWTLARKGNVTSTQCVLYEAYKCASNLERWMGFDKQSKLYIDCAQSLKGKIQELGWDIRKGVFKDICTLDEDIRNSLDANAYAIMFGIASKEQAGESLEFVRKNMWTDFGTKVLYPEEASNGKNWPHNRHIWPFVVSFEVEARLATSRIDTALELLNTCWGNMISKGSGTFWEIVDGTTGDFMNQRIHEPGDDIDTWNSYCHGWSAGVSYLLQAYVAGIKPLEPGFSKFAISPQPGGMDFVTATVPTPHGEIVIDILSEGQGNSYKGYITVPEKTCGIWKSDLYSIKILSSKTGNGEMALSAGTHEFMMVEV